jgi:hypothetical protein
MKPLLPQPRRHNRLNAVLWTVVAALALVLGMVVWVSGSDADSMLPDDMRLIHSTRNDEQTLALLAEMALTVMLLLPVVYLSAMCHEVGHAILGRWAGYVVRTSGMGLGRPLLRWRIAGIQFYLGDQTPFQGLTLVFQPRLLSSRTQALQFGLGGVLANFLLVPLALFGWAFWPFEYGGLFWLLAAGFNLVFAVANLLPIRVRIGRGVLMSDGAMVLYALRAGQFPSAPVNTIAMVHTLRGLLQDLGDRFMQTIYGLAAAQAWLALGSGSRASELCMAATRDAEPLSPVVEGLIALTRAGVAIKSHGPEQAAAFLAQAESAFGRLQHEAGLLYVALRRAELLVRVGDSEGALRELEPIGTSALVRGRPVVRAEWLVLCMEAHLALPNGGLPDDLWTRYDAIRRRFPSVERDLTVSRALATHSSARGDWTAAEPHFRTALEAAQKLHDGLPTDADRAHFLECQRPLLVDPATSCFVQLGKGEEAAQITSRFRPQPGEPEVDLPSASDLPADPRYQRRLRNRRYLQLGMLLSAFDMAAGVGLVLLLVHWHSGQGVRDHLLFRAGLFYVLIVLVGALLVLFIGGIWYLLGTVFPALTSRLGWVLPLLALAPWGAATLFVTLWLIATTM